MNQHNSLAKALDEPSIFAQVVAEDTQESIQLRVIRQLIEAILFEKIVTYDYQTVKGQYGRFDFSIGNSRYQARGYIGGFGRIRLISTSIQRQLGAKWVAPVLNTIVNNITTNQVIQQQLQGELEQTIALCQWNKEHVSISIPRRALSYRELESKIDEGHPYHPCFKSRSGFSLQDHALYGPEQANSFQLQWLAVRRQYIKQCIESKQTISQEKDQAFWQHEIGEEGWQLLQQAMAMQTLSWQEYSLLPIHPWQWKSLYTELAEPLQQRHLVNLGKAGDYYQASLSVRTLINVSYPKKANIKLPLNMVNSSSLRTLEPHSVCTAPLLSQWLMRLVDKDNFFQQQTPLGLLPEYAGVRLFAHQPLGTTGQPSWANTLSEQLSVIFRESVECQHQGNNSLPFVALMVEETDGKPFIHPWIESYGCEPWLSQLIDTAIIPPWHLLVKHGIALETHAQNMVLVHDKGWPQKIILRDFHESLEYVETYLAEPQLAPSFENLEDCYHNGSNNQYYWMDSIEALRELLIDTLFVFNLSELAALLERHYHYSENDFWQLVHARLQNYNNAGHTCQQRIRKIDTMNSVIQTESLLKKKLSGERDKEFHHTIENPFARLLGE